MQRGRVRKRNWQTRIRLSCRGDLAPLQFEFPIVKCRRSSGSERKEAGWVRVVRAAGPGPAYGLELRPTWALHVNTGAGAWPEEGCGQFDAVRVSYRGHPLTERAAAHRRCTLAGVALVPTPSNIHALLRMRSPPRPIARAAPASRSTWGFPPRTPSRNFNVWSRRCCIWDPMEGARVVFCQGVCCSRCWPLMGRRVPRAPAEQRMALRIT